MKTTLLSAVVVGFAALAANANAGIMYRPGAATLQQPNIPQVNPRFRPQGWQGLNPQPEPPSRPQLQPFAPLYRPQGWHGLNPQPEPPGRR